MAITEEPAARAAAQERFDSVSPATGAVARPRLRRAARAPFAFKGVLARSRDELCDLVHRENGKPTDDALIEVLLATEHLDWAGRVLRPRRVAPSLLTRNQRAWVEYQPFGVLGVIGPWNHAMALDHRSAWPGTVPAR
jgi:acyl-CoA reductase-like NAD-dependent aldehyde dehydrogenase